MKRTGPTNPCLKKLIDDLKRKSLELKAPIWKKVAEDLEKPRRRKVEVNLVEIERNASKDETVIVPGVVLGSGELSKPVTIAAWKFSPSAEKKIKKAEGKMMTIEELVKENPKGSGVKVLV
jgi:large subunit ribosomal protein L18e